MATSFAYLIYQEQVGEGWYFYVLSTEQMKGIWEWWQARGRWRVGVREGAWDVSSPTIPTPNQPLFKSFTLPINVIHNKFLLKRFYVPVNFMFQEKSYIWQKRRWGWGARSLKKGNGLYKSWAFDQTPFIKNVLWMSITLFVLEKSFTMHSGSPNNSNYQKAQLTILYSVDTINRE